MVTVQIYLMSEVTWLYPTHFISVAGSGYIVLPLIRKDVHTDHVVLQKKLQFPWKTDAFKGIVEVIQIGAM